MHCDVRWGVGAQVMRVANYSHFALNKFESLIITLGYNALPLIIFDYAVHISSSKPNPCTNFSHNHNVHSRLQHSLVKFLNIESRYSLSHVSREIYIFGLIDHIRPPKTIIFPNNWFCTQCFYVYASARESFYMVENPLQPSEKQVNKTQRSFSFLEKKRQEHGHRNGKLASHREAR